MDKQKEPNEEQLENEKTNDEIPDNKMNEKDQETLEMPNCSLWNI